MNNLFQDIKEIVKPNKKGIAKIDHFEVSKSEARLYNAKKISELGTLTYIMPGKYVRLLVNESLYMSDTQMERRSNRDFINQANGHVLIAGLGIGLILHPLFKSKKVTSITVLEKYQDVIDLIKPTVINKKLTIINTNAFDWKPPKGLKWDTIYFDIWSDINTDNLKEITRLKRKFARRLNRNNVNAKISAWLEKELRYLKTLGY